MTHTTQFAYDNAELPDSINYAEEAIVNQLDNGDDEMTTRCAEHCCQHLDEEMAFRITEAMIRQLAITANWESLRNAIAKTSPALADALQDVAWMIGKRQPEFIEKEARRISQ